MGLWRIGHWIQIQAVTVAVNSDNLMTFCFWTTFQFSLRCFKNHLGNQFQHGDCQSLYGPYHPVLSHLKIPTDFPTSLQEPCRKEKHRVPTGRTGEGVGQFRGEKDQGAEKNCWNEKIGVNWDLWMPLVTLEVEIWWDMMGWSDIGTLPETNSKSTWKWMVGTRSFPFGARHIFRCFVRFREGKLGVMNPQISNQNTSWIYPTTQQWQM